VKRLVVSAFLEKLARHLALLASLGILSKAAGWTETGQATILGLIVVATLTHWCSRAAAGTRKESSAP
jgi:hypothetical protein